MRWDTESHDIPFPLKIIGAAVVGLFVLIGLIGLILPIIPGVLFLALAAFVLAKISGRFAYYLDSQPLWQKIQRRWRSARVLSILEKIKLTGLYAARSIIEGLENLSRAIRSRIG